MSGSCIIPLLRDYDVKEVKSHTFKLKRDDNTEKETFEFKGMRFYLFDIIVT